MFEGGEGKEGNIFPKLGMEGASQQKRSKNTRMQAQIANRKDHFFGKATNENENHKEKIVLEEGPSRFPKTWEGGRAKT